MQLREAAPADIPLIRSLAASIWPEAYGNIISGDQIKYMLELIYSEEALQTQMEKGHRFVLAFRDHLPVGFASFSKKSANEPQTFRLHKLYVLPRQQTPGTGSILLNYIIEESKKDGANQLELNVNKYNTAKVFYDKKGFTILRDEVLDIGGGFVMDDYVMVKDV